jgi:hypothetical protein
MLLPLFFAQISGKLGQRGRRPTFPAEKDNFYPKINFDKMYYLVYCTKKLRTALSG